MHVILRPRQPYDLTRVLGFLSRRAVPGVERVTDGVYERALGPAQATSLVQVRAAGARGLRVDLQLRAPWTRERVLAGVRAVFDLDTDPEAVRAVLQRDTRLRALLRARPGLRVPGTWDGFELSVRAILGQQVSVAGATTLARRLVEALGERRADAPAGLDRCFPTPQRLATASMDGLGLTGARIRALQALAEAVATGTLHFDPDQDLSRFVSYCIRLPGIGSWTAHYIAMRALRIPDAFPAGDLIVRQRLGGGTPVREREAEAASQRWRPWRAYAVLHLWNADAPLT